MDVVEAGLKRGRGNARNGGGIVEGGRGGNGCDFEAWRGRREEVKKSRSRNFLLWTKKFGAS
jgi:hypothetical protein